MKTKASPRSWPSFLLLLLLLPIPGCVPGRAHLPKDRILFAGWTEGSEPYVVRAEQHGLKPGTHGTHGPAVMVDLEPVSYTYNAYTPASSESSERPSRLHKAFENYPRGYAETRYGFAFLSGLYAYAYDPAARRFRQLAWLGKGVSRTNGMVSMSYDATRLAFSSCNGIEVLDARTNGTRRYLEGAWTYDSAFSGDGKRLAVAATVRFVPEDGELRRHLPYDNAFHVSKGILVVDLESGSVVDSAQDAYSVHTNQGFPPRPGTVHEVPTAYCGDSEMREVMDYVSLRLGSRLAFNPVDGRLLMPGRIRNPANRTAEAMHEEFSRMREAMGEFRSLQVSRDGKKAGFWVSGDDTVKWIDLETGDEGSFDVD